MIKPPKISMAAARVNAEMTQKEAASALNVSTQTLRSWENGLTMPSVAKAEEMAKLYKYPMDFIFFRQVTT